MEIQAVPSTSTRRRSRSDSEDGDHNAAKRSRYILRKWLDNKNLQELSDEDGSVLSFQNQETDEPHDTPYEDTSSECESSHVVDIEYECVSDSNHEILHSDISTGDEDVVAAGAIAAVLCHSSITDCEEDSDSSTVERVELESTKWPLCIQCNEKNNNPLYRFCQECYQKRKELFPPHPRGFKKRDELKVKLKKKLKSKVCSQDSGNGSFNLNVLETQSEFKRKRLTDSDTENIESGTENSKRLKLDITAICSNNNLPMSNLNNNHHDIPVSKIPLDQDSAGTSKKSVPVENNEIKAKELSISLKKKNAPSFAVTTELCMICATVTKDSIFLHGTTGHLACCYQCSMKTWKTTKCCPVCKAKVRNVVKIYS